MTASVAKEALEGHCIYDGGYCKLHLTYSRHTDLNLKVYIIFWVKWSNKTFLSFKNWLMKELYLSIRKKKIKLCALEVLLLSFY